MSILIFLMLFTAIAKPQVGDSLIQKAESFYENGKYLQSAQAYDQAFKTAGKATLNDMYNAACSFALAGDTAQSVFYLEKAADHGFYELKYLNQDSDLESLHTLNSWQDIIQKVQANYDKLNITLKEKLEDIYWKDQALRFVIEDAYNKFTDEPEVTNYLEKLIKQQDSINLYDVEKIIEENGWPGINQVGDRANTTVWVVIQHSPLKIELKYLPLLRESVEKGESNPAHLAMLEDRSNMFQNKPQLYGSQIVPSKVPGKCEVYNLYEPEYVDQRRKEVGLGPIEDYVKQYGIEWTIKQKNNQIKFK